MQNYSAILCAHSHLANADSDASIFSIGGYWNVRSTFFASFGFKGVSPSGVESFCLCSYKNSNFTFTLIQSLPTWIVLLYFFNSPRAQLPLWSMCLARKETFKFNGKLQKNTSISQGSGGRQSLGGSHIENVKNHTHTPAFQSKISISIEPLNLPIFGNVPPCLEPVGYLSPELIKLLSRVFSIYIFYDSYV